VWQADREKEAAERKEKRLDKLRFEISTISTVYVHVPFGYNYNPLIIKTMCGSRSDFLRCLNLERVRGASKIKVKNVNKKRTVTVRRLIIFLNISRRPWLICLQCCLHQYKTLKAVATATAAIVLLTPGKNLKKVFLGFLVVSPLFNHFLG